MGSIIDNFIGHHYRLNFYSKITIDEMAQCTSASPFLSRVAGLSLAKAKEIHPFLYCIL